MPNKPRRKSRELFTCKTLYVCGQQTKNMVCVFVLNWEYDTMFVATHWVSRPWAGFICSRPCCFEKLAVDSVLINLSLKFFRRNLLLLKEWLKQTKMSFTQPHVMPNLFDFHLWNIKVLHNCILYTIEYVQWDFKQLKSSLKVAHSVCAFYINKSYKGLW